MIDMHTHILPGIDDGAASREEALMLTECLYHQEVTTAVCTPHFYPMEETLEAFVIKRTGAMKAITNSRIALIPASETYLHRYLFHNPDLKPLCIGNTGYLLVELPDMNVWTEVYKDELERLIKDYNLKPIVAHIDRYKPLMRSRKLLRELKDMGCLLQMNTSAVIKAKTRRRALKLIKEGYVNVLGSDCHNISYRPPVIEEAREIILHKLGWESWEGLMGNAKSIVNSLDNKESEHTE